MNKWEIFRSYINSKYEGDLITRKEIHTATNTKLKTGNYGSTIDTYKRVLIILDVLEETNKLGVYRVKKHIRETTPYSFLKELAYDERSFWKRWFMEPDLYRSAPKR